LIGFPDRSMVERELDGGIVRHQLPIRPADRGRTPHSTRRSSAAGSAAPSQRLGFMTEIQARAGAVTEMKQLIIIAVIGYFAWQAYAKDRLATESFVTAEMAASSYKPAAQQGAKSSAQFQCDGRTYCSQMTSCAEATYFLRNCPGTKMDGNNDGVPCERQWCR